MKPSGLFFCGAGLPAAGSSRDPHRAERGSHSVFPDLASYYFFAAAYISAALSQFTTFHQASM